MGNRGYDQRHESGGRDPHHRGGRGGGRDESRGGGVWRNEGRYGSDWENRDEHRAGWSRSSESLRDDRDFRARAFEQGSRGQGPWAGQGGGYAERDPRFGPDFGPRRDPWRGQHDAPVRAQTAFYGPGGYGLEWGRVPNEQGERHFDSGRDWGHSVYERGPDFGRGQGFGRRDAREHDESFGEQIRHAGQDVVTRVKRAFRGPKGYKRSDERIREDVSDRLSQLDDLDPSDIEVTVSSGEVTLTGTVGSRREKFMAEEIADDVSGVTEVHNQLRLRRFTDEQASLQATGATGPEEFISAQRRNARA